MYSQRQPGRCHPRRGSPGTCRSGEKHSIPERLENAKRECAERKSPDKPAPQKKPPELGDL